MRGGFGCCEGGVSTPAEEEERFAPAGGDGCGREDSGKGGSAGVEVTWRRLDWALVRTLAVGARWIGWVGFSGSEGKVGDESESWSLGKFASSMPLSGSQDGRVVPEE